MSAPSTVLPGASLDSRGAPPRALAKTRPLYWSIRREIWESRSIYIAPLVVAAVVLLGSMASVIVKAQKLRVPGGSLDGEQLARVIRPFKMAPAPIMLAALIVGAFYALDALHGERRDRSILFWKSLPVSNRTTVLAKAAIPLAVLPAIAYVLSVATQLVLLILGTGILRGSGLSAAAVWAEVHFFQGLVVMLYGLIVHALWLAPLYAWLLLVSAWARRMPVLWAVLPPLVVSALEAALGINIFRSLLMYRLAGAMTEAFSAEARGGDVDFIRQLDPARFLSAPGLWMGLGAATVLLLTTARLRRNREPI